MTVLGIVAGIFLVVVAVTLVRHQVLGRLAFRSASRRPAETVLVVLGSLLGTAIITGSLIVGDTLHDSVRSHAWTQLGPIDQTVTAYGEASLPELRERLATLPEHPDVDGVAFGVRSTGTLLAAHGTDEAQAKPGVALLELDFDEARDLGGDREAAGLGTVATPQAGQVVLSEEVAGSLEVAVGDAIDLFAYGTERSLEVAAVLPQLGVAGYPNGRTAFLAPGTIGAMATEAGEGFVASPPIALALVSNTGGVIEGAERSEVVVDTIRERIAPMSGADVDATKMRLLDDAEQTGSMFSELFLSIGAFAVIAGTLLLVNIFVMLAEERKTELGMMRAVGMRRSHLVRAFLVEGSLYGVAAAALGAVLGIGVGRVIVYVASGIFSSGDWGLSLRFAAEGASIGIGFLAGLVISSITVFATGLRVSRMNIIRAIRDLPEPQRTGPKLRTVIIASTAFLAAGAWTAGSVVQSDPYGVLAGPGLLAITAVPLLSRFVPRRGLVTVLGLALIAWGTAGMELLPGVFDNGDIPVFVLQGVLLTSAAVAVLAVNQDSLGHLIRRVVGGHRLPVRLGLAYPLARRFRTSTTLAMYALVVFTLVFISILSGVFGGQVDRFTEQERGGYDIVLRTSPTDPVPAEVVEAHPGVAFAAPLRYAVWSVEFRPPGHEEFQPWAASGFDHAFVEGGPPALSRWDAAYTDEAAVWDAVLVDPSLIIIDSFFLSPGGPPEQIVRPGETLTMRDPVTGTEVERTVAGQTQGGFAFSGVFASAESVEEVLGPRAAPNRMYVAATSGTDTEALAAALQTELVRHGAEAETFGAMVERNQQSNLQFFRLMQGYLALGLVVGISGLGVIMVRAVRERRREVGALRAVGLQGGQVRSAFLLESGFVALQGIVVGAALSIATAYQVIARANAFGDIDVDFVVPWGELALLLTATLLASLAATAWPARKAARIDPAVALRTAE